MTPVATRDDVLREPVAWRIVGLAGSQRAAVTVVSDIAEAWRTDGHSVEPLYAAVPPTIEARVKGLVWHGEPDWCFVDTPVGSYTVSIQSNTRKFQMGSHGRDREMTADFDTADEAKSAAQADYTARILSALEPVSPSAPTATEAEAVYGLLWRAHTTDKAIHEARHVIRDAIGKDGQKRGIDWARATFGPHTTRLEDMP